ncbi:MAG TPA: peptide ABC transporter substrate-binding protein [Gemmatimonadaceae bacterium]
MILHRASRWSIPGSAAARAALLGAVLGAAACGAPPRPRDVVVYASGADLESANPAVTVHPLSRQVQRHLLFVTPLALDSTLRVVPRLARRWEWSRGGRTLRLHLLAGLRWHDGAPTTARDLAFTWAVVRDPATGSPRAPELAPLEGARVVDDTTIDLHLTAAQAGPPGFLTELPILPAHLLDTVPRAALRRAAFNLAPVGNGPFRFTSRRAGERWVFTRNDAFPRELGGPPALRQVVVAVVDEATTKFAGLASGELDVAGISPTMAALARRDPTLRVVEYPVLFSTALVFNVAHPALRDVRVRRAIGLSVNRERLVRVALAGFGTPALGPVPPENPLALTDVPAADSRVADSLLDAAGWRRAPGKGGWRSRGGQPLAFELLTVGSGDNAIEQLVQDDLAARGIRLAIRQSEMGAFLAAARAVPRRFDLLLTGIPGDLGLSYLSAMFESRNAGGALDYAGYHVPALDSAFAHAARAADPGAKRDAWREVQRQLLRDAPAAWLYHSRGVQGASARLQGVRMDLRGELATIARWRVAP